MFEEAERVLARDCYGYGRWEAPYWFIGLEEGMHPSERNDLRLRAAAFRELHKDGLSDCRRFHEKIGVDSLHGKQSKAALVPTWRSLILLLLTYQCADAKVEDRRKYQAEKWGMANGNGETCVIELSGLPARSLNIPRDRELFREERLRYIDQQAEKNRAKLKFIVIYGTSQWPIWKKFWDDKLKQTGSGADISRMGSVLVAFAQHPTALGLTNDYWIDLGERLRCEATVVSSDKRRGVFSGRFCTD